MKLLFENWRRYLKESEEDYIEDVEKAETDMIDELLETSDVFKAAWEEMEKSIEGTSHHFGETTAEHTRNVLNALNKLIEDSDEEIDDIRRRKLQLAAVLHDVAKPETRAVEPSGRVRFFGHPEQGVQKAEEILRELGETDIEAITKLVEYHMEILIRAEDLRGGELEGRALKTATKTFIKKIGDQLEDLILVARANVLAILEPEGAQVVPDRNWDEFRSDMEDHVRAADDFVAKVRQTVADMNKPVVEETPEEFLTNLRQRMPDASPQHIRSILMNKLKDENLVDQLMSTTQLDEEKKGCFDHNRNKTFKGKVRCIMKKKSFGKKRASAYVASVVRKTEK
jgi:putative nucleotidyltransferase with HDIG domain